LVDIHPYKKLKDCPKERDSLDVVSKGIRTVCLNPNQRLFYSVIELRGIRNVFNEIIEKLEKECG
jgi:hypothetical protein